MTGTGMDFALYLRKSVGRKAVPRQRALTTAYITELGGRIIAEFPDTDRTAFRKPDGDQPKRDGFTAMLAMLRANPGLGVAAWHADRLTRNDEDTAELIRVCAAGDHLVVTQSGGFYDLSAANGRKRLRDDASAAIYEVDHNRERVLAARAEVASDGRWLGGKRPFGWEPDPNPVDRDGLPMLDEDGRPVKGMLRLREAEAAALMAAHYEVLDGVSLGAIARDWNAKGILTSVGKPWRRGEVGRVLRRPRNAGLMEHCGQITGLAKWPAIVPENTWRAVAAMLADSARRTTPGPERRHLLTWLATCGVCGSPVFCTSTSKAASRGGTRRKTYRCRDTRGHVARDAAALDDFITRLVIERLSRPDAARLLVRPGSKPDIAALQTEAAAIRDLMTARDRLHRQRVIDDQMLTEGLAELRAELAGVEQRIADAGQADVLAPLIGNPAEVWARLSLGQRRAVIDTLMTVTVLPSPKGRPWGWQSGEPYFRPDSITISWKR
jgi:DNA invertase Pin-like site-specific DNA recombinase